MRKALPCAVALTLPAGWTAGAPAASVPAFGRLHDWLGPWLIESAAYEGLRAAIARTDWRAHMAAGPDGAEPLTELIPTRGGQSIAVVKLAGTLMKAQSSLGGTSTVQARREINAAARDPSVQGIMLAIDSPGGTADGTAELGDAIKAAARQKPVDAWVDGTAASAAYWAASQADRIHLGSRMSRVGSIGTYQPAYDFSQEFEKAGVKTHLITTGPLKGMGVPGTEITPEQVAYLQGDVNELQSHFDAAVRTGRGMTAAQLSAVRTGAMWRGAQAIDQRLADGVKTFEQALAAIAAAG